MSKLRGMNTQERMEDISRRSGLSIDICRRVINAEAASITDSLRKGERATLTGRVTLRPEIRQKIAEGGILVKKLKIKAEVSQTLENALSDIVEFENIFEPKVDEEKQVKLLQVDSVDDLSKIKRDDKSKGIRVAQISSLL